MPRAQSRVASISSILNRPHENLQVKGGYPKIVSVFFPRYSRGRNIHVLGFNLLPLFLLEVRYAVETISWSASARVVSRFIYIFAAAPKKANCSDVYSRWLGPGHKNFLDQGISNQTVFKTPCWLMIMGWVYYPDLPSIYIGDCQIPFGKSDSPTSIFIVIVK